MCEPCHSIVQYPDHDDDDRSSGTPTEQRISKLGKWLRKFGQWLHLSKMGNGHSEAVAKTSLQTELFLPTPTLYEVNWWEREIHIDGSFRGGFNGIGRNALIRHSEWSDQHKILRETLRKEAFEAAQKYANAVSIGDMTTFRRFFTTSMQKTDEPIKYVLHFQLMLNRIGRELLAKRLKEFTIQCGRVNKTNVDRVTKLLLGFTRKRELLTSEWADNKSLWVPSKPCLE
jgi:hypothetical protein